MGGCGLAPFGVVAWSEGDAEGIWEFENHVSEHVSRVVQLGVDLDLLEVRVLIFGTVLDAGLGDLDVFGYAVGELLGGRACVSTNW
jgi:hypothetical protein